MFIKLLIAIHLSIRLRFHILQEGIQTPFDQNTQ